LAQPIWFIFIKTPVWSDPFQLWHMCQKGRKEVAVRSSLSDPQCVCVQYPFESFAGGWESLLFGAATATAQQCVYNCSDNEQLFFIFHFSLPFLLFACWLLRLPAFFRLSFAGFPRFLTCFWIFHIVCIHFALSVRAWCPCICYAKRPQSVPPTFFPIFPPIWDGLYTIYIEFAIFQAN